MSASRKAVAFWLAVMLLSSVVGGAFVALTNTYQAETVTYQTNSGVNVTLNGTRQVGDGNPFPNDNTLTLNTTDGNVTVSGTGAANATLEQLTGERTIVSNLDVQSNPVTIDPEDKQAVTVSGNTTDLEFESVVVDDGNVDFSYAGPSGETTVTIEDVGASRELAAVEGGTVVDIATSTTGGDVTFTLPNSQHDISVQSTTISRPTFSNPSPVGPQSETPNQLAVNVSDDDFPGDEVQVNISLDGTQQTSTNITSDSRVTASIGSISPGEHTWTVEATDSEGKSNTETYQFGVPQNVTFYNESNTSEIVTDVTATFYTDGEEVFTRSTTNGTIPLEGLPASEDIVVEATAANYSDRTIIIDDIAEQWRAYLLPTNVSSVEVRYTLDDPTGQFPQSESSLYIKRPLTIGNNTTFQTIAADEFGVEGVTVNLEEDVRYRLVLRNDDGDSRTLGAYTAVTSETVTLRPSSLALNYSEFDGYSWDFRYVNESNNPTLIFEFSDPQYSTTNLDVVIYERGNRSNTLSGYPVEYDGPLGNVSITEPLTDKQANTTWVVEWTAVHDGVTIDSSTGVSENRLQFSSLPAWLMEAVSLALILITAGLFSRANAGVGAMTTALVSGVFWWIGWLGNASTGASIVLAIGVAALFWAGDNGGV